jgi:hypothetical protein
VKTEEGSLQQHPGRAGFLAVIVLPAAVMLLGYLALVYIAPQLWRGPVPMPHQGHCCRGTCTYLFIHSFIQAACLSHPLTHPHPPLLVRHPPTHPPTHPSLSSNRLHALHHRP